MKNNNLKTESNNANVLLASRLKNLIATEKTKRKNNHICAKCATDIVVGEKYMSVYFYI